MIVLCPKAFSQYILRETPHPEAGFLKEYVSNTDKAYVCNEVWETFRMNIIENSENKENAEGHIVHQRAFIRPEEIKRNNEHEEEPAKEIHSSDVLITKTKSLIERNYADIDIFLTPDASSYTGTPNIDKVKVMDVGRFFVEAMGDEKLRIMIENYLRGSSNQEF